MCYESNNYNDEERLREHIELNGSVVDVVYMNEVGFILHLTHQFGRACRGQSCQRIHPTQRDWKLSLVVGVGCEGVIAHDVTLYAYNIDKLLEFI
jgi:hypothetical protein